MSESWSVSRARAFASCRRQYYYRYCLAPLARRPHPPAEAVEADRVRGLVGLETWVGEVVHTVIGVALNRWRAGRGMDEAEAVEHAVRLLSRQFRDSREYWSAPVEAYTRRPPLLDLHYHGDGALSREKAAALKEMAGAALRQFFRSPVAWRIQEVGPGRWLPIDRNAAARLPNGVLILVKPDFAYRDGDRLHILDWKTGRPDPFWDLVQVACYARYAAERWGHPAEEVEPAIVYLYPEFLKADVRYDARAVAEVETLITESHAEIMAAAAWSAEPERFAYAEDPARCRWCAFRRLCDGAGRAG